MLAPYLKRIALTARDRKKLFDRGLMSGRGHAEMNALTKEESESLKAAGAMTVRFVPPSVIQMGQKRPYEKLEGLSDEQKAERKKLQRKFATHGTNYNSDIASALSNN